MFRATYGASSCKERSNFCVTSKIWQDFRIALLLGYQIHGKFREQQYYHIIDADRCTKPRPQANPPKIRLVVRFSTSCYVSSLICRGLIGLGLWRFGGARHNDCTAFNPKIMWKMASIPNVRDELLQRPSPARIRRIKGERLGRSHRTEGVQHKCFSSYREDLSIIHHHPKHDFEDIRSHNPTYTSTRQFGDKY